MDIRQMQPLLRAKGIHIADDDMAFNLLGLNEVVFENIRTGSQIDIEKMRYLLLQKGVRVAAGDPIFALLAVNGIALEHLTKRHKQELDCAGMQRLSGRIENFTYLKILAVAAFALGAGMFLGRMDASYFIFGVLDIALGAVLGVTGGQIMKKRNQQGGACLTQKSPNSWTEAELNQAVAGMRPQLSSRVLKACRGVLIEGVTVANAAANEKLFPAQVERALDRIARRN